MNMLLLNISREKIILQGKGYMQELVYKDIERRLPPLLIEMIDTYAIDTLWVVNGPGSFTTLRIGSLTVNLLTHFGRQLDIYASNKLDIYKYAVEGDVLPVQGFVFIGQKKNMWEIINSGKSEMKNGWQCKIVNKDSLGDLDGEYFIDPCEHILLKEFDISKMVVWDFDGEKLHLQWYKKSISFGQHDLGLKPVKYLEPDYLIEPQIG